MGVDESNKSVHLSYKQEGPQFLAEDEEKDVSLDAFSLWLRILLCPVAMPCLFCISFLFPDKSEEYLGEDDSLISLSRHGSLESYGEANKSMFSKVLEFVGIAKAQELEIVDPNADSKNEESSKDVISQEEKEKLELLRKYKDFALNCCRTDHMILPYDGAWINGLYLSVKELEEAGYDVEIEHEGDLFTSSSVDDLPMNYTCQWDNISSHNSQLDEELHPVSLLNDDGVLSVIFETASATASVASTHSDELDNNLDPLSAIGNLEGNDTVDTTSPIPVREGLHYDRDSSIAVQSFSEDVASNPEIEESNVNESILDVKMTENSNHLDLDSSDRNRTDNVKIIVENVPTRESLCTLSSNKESTTSSISSETSLSNVMSRTKKVKDQVNLSPNVSTLKNNKVKGPPIQGFLGDSSSNSPGESVPMKLVLGGRKPMSTEFDGSRDMFDTSVDRLPTSSEKLMNNYLGDSMSLSSGLSGSLKGSLLEESSVYDPLFDGHHSGATLSPSLYVPWTEDSDLENNMNGNSSYSDKSSDKRYPIAGPKYSTLFPVLMNSWKTKSYTSPMKVVPIDSEIDQNDILEQRAVFSNRYPYNTHSANNLKDASNNNHSRPSYENGVRNKVDVGSSDLNMSTYSSNNCGLNDDNISVLTNDAE